MYRTVNCSMWDDPWFEDLPPVEKLLFMYLITNRRGTPCGAFEVTLKAIRNETGIEGDIGLMLQCLAPRVMWWPEHNVVWVRNFYKYQRCNDKFTIGARKAALTFPVEVHAEIGKQYPELSTGLSNRIASQTESDKGNTYGMDTVSNGMDTPAPVTESDSETENPPCIPPKGEAPDGAARQAADGEGQGEPPCDDPLDEPKQPADTDPSSGQGKRQARFVPPSPQMAAAFFKSIERPDLADEFMDHFTSNGWRVGGKAAMKDWQAAARNWKRYAEKREAEGNRRRGGGDSAGGAMPSRPTSPNSPPPGTTGRDVLAYMDRLQKEAIAGINLASTPKDTLSQA